MRAGPEESRPVASAEEPEGVPLPRFLLLGSPTPGLPPGAEDGGWPRQPSGAQSSAGFPVTSAAQAVPPTAGQT